MISTHSWPLEIRRPSPRASLTVPHPHCGSGQEIFLPSLGAIDATKRLLQRDPEVSYNWDKLETLNTTTQLLVAFAFVPTIFSLALLVNRESAFLVLLYASLGLISSGLGYATDLLCVRIKKQSPLFQFEDSRIRKIHLVASTSCILIATLTLIVAHYGWFDRSRPSTPRQSIRRQVPSHSAGQLWRP